MQQTAKPSEFEQFQQNGVIPEQPSLAMSEYSTTQAEGPVGIGGWLLLPILGLFGSIGWTGYNLITGYSEIAYFLTNLDNLEMTELIFPVLLSLGVAVILIGFSGFALFQIFTRSPNAPRTMVVYFIVVVILITIDGWATNQIEAFNEEPLTPYSKDVWQAVLRAILWIPYFRMSKRVANTFKRKEKNIDQQLEKIFN